MRIGIDARFFGSIGKGLGRYTQKLIENLEKIDLENQYVVFLRKENFDEYQPKNKNFHKVSADYQWYSFAEQLRFPSLLAAHKLDLMHFPHFNVPLLYRKKFVITIHDLILLHFPTLRNTTLNPWYYWLKFCAYKLVIFCAIHRSSSIITVSEFTKSDILQHYRVPKNKIVVTHEASEDFCRLPAEEDDAVLEKYGIIKPYVLYVGNAYPHKNLERLIGAFEFVREKKNDLNLVLVGKHDYFYLVLRELVKTKNISGVIFPGFIPDQDLDSIYKNAGVYVFPSLYEGFGLPPLEAMSMGAPVVSSDHACMREILGESALFVDAEKEKVLAEGILKMIEDEPLRQQFIQRGYVQITKYDWHTMTRDTLSEYLRSL